MGIPSKSPVPRKVNASGQPRDGITPRIDQGQPAGDGHSGEGGDEGDQPAVNHQRPIQETEGQPGDQPGEDRPADRPPVPNHQSRRQRPGESHHRSNR